MRRLVVLLVLGCLSCNQSSPESLTPRWGRPGPHRIADFSLTTQTGATLTRSDLLGRMRVSSFLFTSCDQVCPRLVGQLLKVQQRAAARDDLQLVSFTAAPAYDTPERLGRFGLDAGIDPERWLLATGAPDTIYRLASASYFADDDRLAEGGADALFLHTEKVLLVDARGRLRGVYNGTVGFETAKLLADIELLAAEQPAAIPGGSVG